MLFYSTEIELKPCQKLCCFEKKKDQKHESNSRKSPLNSGLCIYEPITSAVYNDSEMTPTPPLV